MRREKIWRICAAGGKSVLVLSPFPYRLHPETFGSAIVEPLPSLARLALHTRLLQPVSAYWSPSFSSYPDIDVDRQPWSDSNRDRQTQIPMPLWLMSVLFKGPKYAAYTELFAGLSPMLSTKEHQGSYVVLFGRIVYVPKIVSNGWEECGADGESNARKFLGWVDGQVGEYL